MTQSVEHRVIQVSNVASTVTADQLLTLFNHVGSVEDCQLYPSEDQPLENGTRICYVKFKELWSVGVAMHLSNVQFMERPLLIFPMDTDAVPDEQYAITQLAPGAPISSSDDDVPEVSGIRKLTNEISTNAAGAQVINTIDPTLALKGAPNYPALPGCLSDENVEEIRRTIYVGNLDPNLTNEIVMKFFSQCGEIKYVRMGGETGASMKHAFVEFTEQVSVGNAFQFNGTLLGSRAMVVSHSSTAIVKPKPVDPRVAAETLQAKAQLPAKARSRSRSRTRRKSRSTSRRRRSPRRSRSRSKGKRRSRSRERKRSRDRKRSHSRKRSRSRRRSRSRITSREGKRSKDIKEKQPSPRDIKDKLGPRTPEGSGPRTPERIAAEAHSSVTSNDVVETSVSASDTSHPHGNGTTENGRGDVREKDKDRKDKDRTKRKSRSRSRERRRRSRSRERKRRSTSRKRRKSRSTSKKRSRSRDRRQKSRTRSKSVERPKRRSRSREKRRKRSPTPPPPPRERRRSRSKEKERPKKRSRSPHTSELSTKQKPPPPPPRDYDEEEREMAADPLNPAAVAASIIAPLQPMGPALPPPPPPPPPASARIEVDMDMDLSD